MTQEERYGTRDGSYSAWHRRKSTRRFVGVKQAEMLAMIDLDVALYVEYEDATKLPICLIETAQDVGQRIKPSTVTKNLAKAANIPAFTVLYTLSNNKNPADECYFDISKFRIKQLYPEETPNWMELSPEEYAKTLWDIRENIEKTVGKFSVRRFLSRILRSRKDTPQTEFVGDR